MNRASILLVALCVASPVFADGFCDRLDGLIQGQTLDAAMTFPNSAVEAESCRPSLGLGGTKAVNCAWPFDYRAPEARAKFEQMVARVETCLGTGAAAEKDGLVNHPDSYDLRTYAIPTGSVAVSLKDKGALQKTYVFLKVERTP